MRIAIIDTGWIRRTSRLTMVRMNTRLSRTQRAQRNPSKPIRPLDLLDADEINEKLSLLHIKEGVSAADLYRQKRSHTAIATSTRIWT